MEQSMNIFTQVKVSRTFHYRPKTRCFSCVTFQIVVAITKWVKMLFEKQQQSVLLNPLAPQSILFIFEGGEGGKKKSKILQTVFTCSRDMLDLDWILIGWVTKPIMLKGSQQYTQQIHRQNR